MQLPKSHSLYTEELVSSTFSILRSRCAIGGRCECKCWTALSQSSLVNEHGWLCASLADLRKDLAQLLLREERLVLLMRANLLNQAAAVAELHQNQVLCCWRLGNSSPARAREQQPAYKQRTLWPRETA